MFQQFENNLLLLEKSLEKSNQVKEKMIIILDRFEGRFSKLEQEMKKMNEHIDGLKLSHDNIDETIKSIDQVLNQFNVPQKVEKRLEEGINNDLDSFLQCLDQINDASSFFTKHTSYKGADKLFEKLQSLKQKAIRTLEKEFKNELLSASKRDIDPYTIQQHQNGFDLIPSEKLDELNKIAKRLAAMNAIQYRKQYKDIRSKVLVQALNKIYSIDARKKKKTLAEITTHVVQNKKQQPIKYYVKGSHKFIFYMNFYLKLLEAERKIANKLIFGKQSKAIFAEVIIPSLNVFIEQFGSLAERKEISEKIFVLLDVLENFENRLRGKFDEVVGVFNILKIYYYL